jgi:tetratricopeptide (TPR) repeat protein
MAPDLISWIPLLGVPLGLELPDTPQTAGLDVAYRRGKLNAVVVELLEALMPSPTLITIEDGHWLDDASAELIRQLLVDVDRRPWAVIVTRRDEPEGLQLDDSESLARVWLQPLAGEAALSLAAAVAGESVIAPYLFQEMVDRSAGNPLFLQEMVAAASAGALTELPDSVEAVMAASIDTLGPEDRTVLRRAAVLGARFHPSELAWLMGVSPATVTDQMERLDHFLLADDSGMVRFRHGLIRDVAYEGLPFRSRRELHGRAASMIEEEAGNDPEAFAELLSLHSHEARRYAASWRYSRHAGERAQRNAAPIEAAGFFSRALEAGRQLPNVGSLDLADVAERLGDANELGGQYDQAAAAYRQARRLGTVDRLRVAGLYQKEGRLCEREGRLTVGLRWFRKAINELDQIGPELEARRLRASVSTLYGAFRLRQGRHQQAIPLLEEGAAEGLATGAQQVVADAYRLMDWAHIELGIFDRDTVRQESLAIYEALDQHVGQSKVLNNMGIAAYYQGQWDASVSYYERSAEAASRAGDIVFRAMLLNNIAEIRSDQGRIAEAEQLLHSALSIWRGSKSVHFVGLAVSNLGRAAARAGRIDEAAGRLREAREAFQAIGANTMLLEADAREAERLVLANQPDAALALAEDVTTRTERFGGMPYVLAMLDRLTGYALCQQGDSAGAWRRLEASLERARAARVDYEIAMTLEAMTRVGPLRGAPSLERLATEAAGIFERLGVVSTPVVRLDACAV